MKKILSLAGVLLISIALNFGLFSVAYNKLAVPYLHESQRVDNAELIMFLVLPAFILFAFISILLTYILARKMA
jgi:hypothetical protein